MQKRGGNRKEKTMLNAIEKTEILYFRNTKKPLPLKKATEISENPGGGADIHINRGRWHLYNYTPPGK